MKKILSWFRSLKTIQWIIYSILAIVIISVVVKNWRHINQIKFPLFGIGIDKTVEQRETAKKEKELEEANKIHTSVSFNKIELTPTIFNGNMPYYFYSDIKIILEDTSDEVDLLFNFGNNEIKSYSFLASNHANSCKEILKTRSIVRFKCKSKLAKFNFYFYALNAKSLFEIIEINIGKYNKIYNYKEFSSRVKFSDISFWELLFRIVIVGLVAFLFFMLFMSLMTRIS